MLTIRDNSKQINILTVHQNFSRYEIRIYGSNNKANQNIYLDDIVPAAEQPNIPELQEEKIENLELDMDIEEGEFVDDGDSE